MKRFLIITGAVSLLTAATFAAEQSMLARVTVYWASGGSGSDSWTRKHQAATKVRLRSGHCAVDPRRIPYGSKVILPDATLTAVDTGGHVKSRRAARRIGRSEEQRNAVVVDRFFETKAQALAWAKKHPHFMKVRVVSRTNLIESTPAGETRTTTKTSTTLSRVAPSAVSAPAPALANAPTASRPQPALRTSVPTARTPAAPLVARASQPSAASTSRPQAANATTPNAPALPPPVVSARLRQASAPRVASNSTRETPPIATTPANVMIHGPSHYNRAVAYVP
jgi:3D (Asp-Asp-Asp) domain-containing protein